jgi:hypothetical protein
MRDFPLPCLITGGYTGTIPEVFWDDKHGCKIWKVNNSSVNQLDLKIKLPVK